MTMQGNPLKDCIHADAPYLETSLNSDNLTLFCNHLSDRTLHGKSRSRKVPSKSRSRKVHFV